MPRYHRVRYHNCGWRWVPATVVSDPADLLYQAEGGDGLFRELVDLVESGERSDTTSGTPPRFSFDVDQWTFPPTHGVESDWEPGTYPGAIAAGGFCPGWYGEESPVGGIGYQPLQWSNADQGSQRVMLADVVARDEDGNLTYLEQIALYRPLAGPQSRVTYGPAGDLTVEENPALGLLLAHEGQPAHDPKTTEDCSLFGTVGVADFPPLGDGIYRYNMLDGFPIDNWFAGYYAPPANSGYCIAHQWVGQHGTRGKFTSYLVARSPLGVLTFALGGCPPPDESGQNEPPGAPLAGALRLLLALVIGFGLIFIGTAALASVGSAAIGLAVSRLASVLAGRVAILTLQALRMGLGAGGGSMAATAKGLGQGATAAAETLQAAEAANGASQTALYARYGSQLGKVRSEIDTLKVFLGGKQ